MATAVRQAAAHIGVFTVGTEFHYLLYVIKRLSRVRNILFGLEDPTRFERFLKDLFFLRRLAISYLRIQI